MIELFYLLLFKRSYLLLFKRSLEKTLSELQQYQARHEEWVSLQQKLLLEQATPEMKLESRLEYEEQKIRESSDGRGMLVKTFFFF